MMIKYRGGWLKGRTAMAPSPSSSRREECLDVEWSERERRDREQCREQSRASAQRAPTTRQLRDTRRHSDARATH